jgi:hypothetical protein
MRSTSSAAVLRQGTHPFDLLAKKLIKAVVHVLLLPLLLIMSPCSRHSLKFGVGAAQGCMLG